MTFSREVTRTSRKRRACESCHKHIEVGERYTQWSGKMEDSFGTADYHHDCRTVEVEINHAHDSFPDEWMSLSDLFSDGETLNCAPSAVRVRFGLAPDPEMPFEGWLDELRTLAADEFEIDPPKWRRDFVLGHPPHYALALARQSHEKAKQRHEAEKNILAKRHRAEADDMAIPLVSQ